MKLYKIITLLLSFSLFSFTTIYKKQEKTKTINKEYTVEENATVYVNNKYGNISVTTWNKDKVEILVKITVTGNDLDKIENKLNDITINFEASKHLVAARTQIENSQSKWSWWNSNDNKVNYKINYFIKIPSTNNVDLHNKYGQIDLGELKGKTNIQCNYGNLFADKLLSDSNNIILKYCGNSELDFINTANINADYSKITIKKSYKINANTDYTSLKIDFVEELNFNSDYGTIKITETDIVNGNSDYTSMKFGTINNSIIIDTKYGGTRINNLSKGFQKATINADYSGIKIGTASDNNFNFNIKLNYASFSYPEEGTTLTNSNNKSTKKYYEGYFREETKNSIITIRSNYGGVNLKVND